MSDNGLPRNILVVGVGGQGTILASKIISQAALRLGYDVKQSEVHGMAQRGGSVVTYVRYGERVYSPLIEEGEADLIVAFEKLEALRWLPYLRRQGKLIVNTREILPLPVILGTVPYPADILEKLQQAGVTFSTISADDYANGLGEPRCANVVMVGAAAHRLGFAPDLCQEVVAQLVPAKAKQINMRAFRLGYDAT